MQSPNVQIVLDYLKAYSSHDANRIVAFYSEDIEIYDGAFDSLVVGKEQVRQEVVDVFLNLVPDLLWRQQEHSSIMEDGDIVCIEWEFSGSPNTELEGIPDQCRGLFTCKGMSQFKIDCSSKRILRHADYYNPTAFFAYL